MVLLGGIFGFAWLCGGPVESGIWAVAFLTLVTFGFWILDFTSGFLDFQHRWPTETEDVSSTSPHVTGWIWTCAWALGRPPGKTRSSHPIRRSWTFFVLLLCLLRVGEASHPGPHSQGWSLGIANPSGLNSKVDQIAHMGGWSCLDPVGDASVSGGLAQFC